MDKQKDPTTLGQLAEPADGVLQDDQGEGGRPDDQERVGRQTDAIPPDSQSVLLDFLWNVHTYVNGYIRFADSKAAVTITVAMGILALLFGAGLHKRVAVAPPSQWTGIESAAGASFLLLGLSVVLSVIAIRPRLWERGNSNDFIYWNSIARYKTQAAYWQRIRSQTQPDLAESLTDHIHILSLVCTKKYRYVSLSMLLGLVGSLLGGLALYWL